MVKRREVCITVPILEGLDGVQKWANRLQFIGIIWQRRLMHQKSYHARYFDCARYFELLSFKPMDEVEAR